MESGKTISQVVQERISNAKHDKKSKEEEKLESEYADCLKGIYLKALEINENSDTTYWEDVWIYQGWTKSKNPDELEMYKIGDSIKQIFKNWQQGRLLEDLEKQGLVLRFSYDNNAKINWYANQTLDKSTEFPSTIGLQKLLIWVSLK